MIYIIYDLYKFQNSNPSAGMAFIKAIPELGLEYWNLYKS